jgi:hypothetical protein
VASEPAATLTADQIESAIAAALKAGDIEAITPLMVRLALTDARRAELVLDTLKLGVALAAAEVEDHG